ncbi:MAG: aminotransferase class I/II-fold pyridoxal phosphate-dependent enzyme [Deltaproteobacteria bacterium]|nr:aminotransferase class I/II-fold pyridoxal phosphate-dependent enzyme [Deltaproteobacteria bacterium]
MAEHGHDPHFALTQCRREFGEHGGVSPSTGRSSTFTVMDSSTMPEIFAGLRGPDKGGCFLYSRHFNPTVDVLARYLAAMEGTEFAACTASGMAAISTAILQICHAGDHVVASDTVYGGTRALLNDLLPSMGITTTFVDPSDTAAFEAALTPETKVFYTEVVANPTLKVADIPALSTLAKAHGVTLIADNTFTPMVMSPAKLGADIVVYSLTKFVGGASDFIAGAICASRDFVQKLFDLHTGRIMLFGPTMDPRVAIDLIMRLPHLGLRMQEHGRRALAMAERLDELGVDVTYPGLKRHPHHDLLVALANEGYGFGGMFTIDCKTTEKAMAFMDHLQNEDEFGLMAVSLGYYDTLLSCSSTSTSSEIPVEDQHTMGLSPGLVRISVGYTGTLEQRMEQLVSGVRALGLTTR